MKLTIITSVTILHNAMNLAGLGAIADRCDQLASSVGVELGCSSLWYRRLRLDLGYGSVDLIVVENVDLIGQVLGQ